MLTGARAQTNVLLFGVDETLAAELRGVLDGNFNVLSRKAVSTVPQCKELLDRLRTDVVFCPADRSRYQTVLEAVRQASHRLPVVVISRRAEVSDWLDAIEAGATDYCAAPFEAAHVQWIMETCRHARRAAAA